MLTIGSKAPSLKVSRFLKGEPVTAFEPGKVYVVEFWATWCGPCVAAMPHVTALQQKYPEVTFIGVNVQEEDDSAAETFLNEQGNKIGYRIARDEIPDGVTADDGVMATTWLKAAEQDGIPTAFVIDQQGRIANITHPMSLDESLPQIIAGQWNPTAAAKHHLEETLQSRRVAKLISLFDAEPTDETLATLDQMAADAPDHNFLLVARRIKFRILTSAEDKIEQALAEGQKLLESDLGENALFLNTVTWDVVNPERKHPAPVELQAFALKVAKLADEKTQQKNPAIADTLARALFVNGDSQTALETQRRAVMLAKSDPNAKGMLLELQKRLDEYENAVAQKK